MNACRLPCAQSARGCHQTLAALPLAREHIDDLLTIENASFRTPWSRRMFEDELETAYAHFWVFMHTPACEASAASACGKTPSGADIIAYGGFWDMAGDGNITNVTVAEEYRGRGYGKVVVHFLLGEMARMNMESASLEVRASNAAATRLYEACGFTHVGCRKSYYSDGEAALLFAREVEYGRSPLCKEKGEGAPATPEVLRGSDRE